MAIEIYEFTLQMLVAVLLGGLIGIEREYHKRPAGILTLPLVALAAALLTFLSFNVIGTTNNEQIAGGIITGIGFIGAGAIMREKTGIHGITTAAMIWIVAALGMACGYGFEIEAAIVTVLALAIIFIGYPIKEYFEAVNAPQKKR